MQPTKHLVLHHSSSSNNQVAPFCSNSFFCSKMARFRFSVVNGNRGVGASRTQQQAQEQQRGDTEAGRNTGLRVPPMLPPALALPAFQGSNGSGNGLRPPVLPPALALPAFQGSNRSGNGLVRYETSEDNREELQEERTRLIQRYSGGELQFLIDWFEHIHRDLEEIRRELDSVEEELKRKPSEQGEVGGDMT